MEKVILWGIGPHTRSFLEKHIVPLSDIICFIDNYTFSFEKKVQDKRIFTFDEFIVNHNDYLAEFMVIGSEWHYSEMEQSVLDTGLFDDDHVIYIGDWVKKYPLRGNDLFEVLEKNKTDDIKRLVNQIGIIDDKKMKNAKLYPDRIHGLNDERIKREGNVAEIGVAFGDFTEVILKKLEPRICYAIDIFDESVKGFWGINKFEENNNTHEEYYKHRFCNEIDKGIINIQKGYSWEAMERIPDKSLDFVYLDAAHDYESVKKDINVIENKLVPGGIIQFNDYTFQESYGIIPVVNSLLKKDNAEVLYYCLSENQYDDIAIRLL